MIIGNGLMSNIFYPLDSDDLLIFASGVSNSRCDDPREYEREKNLLIESIIGNKNKKIIYFSTCDVYDNLKSNMYVKHKLDIEDIIKKNCKSWIVYRLPQVIGKGNKNNLLYFLVNNIINETHFNCSYLLERNLIKGEDIRYLAGKYIHLNNEIINLANPINIKVFNIVNIIENVTNKKAIFKKLDDVNQFKIPLRKDFPVDIFNCDYYIDSINDFILDNKY